MHKKGNKLISCYSHFCVDFPVFFGGNRDTITKIGNTLFDQHRHLIQYKMTQSQMKTYRLFFLLSKNYPFDFAGSKGWRN